MKASPVYCVAVAGTAALLLAASALADQSGQVETFKTALKGVPAPELGPKASQLIC